MRILIFGVLAGAMMVGGAQAAGAHRTYRDDQHHYHVDVGKLRGKEFKTLAAARSGCGSSPVVWLNKQGVVFHTAKSRWFGHTRSGVYSCRKAAKAAGFWQSKY